MIQLISVMSHHLIPDQSSQLNSPASGLAILFVESDDLLRPMIANGLRRHGYQVHEAVTAEGAAALWKMHQANIGLLFADVVLPGSFGWESLAKALWADKPGLPVLLTSGGSAQGCKIDQGIGFLPKPFSLFEMLQAVRQTLAPA